MAHPTNDDSNNPKGGNNRKEKSEKTRIHRVDTVDPIGLNASNVHTDQDTGPTALNLHLDELQKKKAHPFITSDEKKTTTDSKRSENLSRGPSGGKSKGTDLSRGPSGGKSKGTDLSRGPSGGKSKGTDLSRGPRKIQEPNGSNMDLSKSPDISSSEDKEKKTTEKNTTEKASLEGAADGNTQGAKGGNAGASKPDPNQASNSGVVAKIMAEVKKQRAKEMQAQKDQSRAITEARKAQKEEKQSEAKNAQETKNNSPGVSVSKTTSTETTTNDSSDPINGLNVEVSAEEKAEMDANAAEEAEGKKVGLMVGRSVGYGARIDSLGGKEKGELKVTPFGETEEEILKNCNEFRSKHHEEAERRGEFFESGYFRGYNQGQPEGVRLKQEATQTARQKALEEESKTPEFQAGATLGLACGTASAKGESQVQSSFMVPDGDKEKKVAVQGPLQEVRAKAMDEQQTPNGELKGEVFERGFMQHYNAAYSEISSKSIQAQGPEIDEDYKAGYDNGYKLGKQKAVGGEIDAALEAEKEAYDKVPDNAPKSEKQKQSGFFMGYNKGIQDGRTKNINAQKAAIEKRNKKPKFMAGFATGTMQGFLKAMLLPSGITVKEAIQNDQKLRAGGIPKHFPIPNLVRKYLTLVETRPVSPGDVNSADVDKATIASPLFQSGLLIGFNQGYANAERNRGTFQREQYKMHPDYQDAVKPVHTDVDEKGDTILMTMGHVIAMVQAKVNFLKNKKNLDATQQEQLSMYGQVRDRLQAEVNKRSEYYERGVIEYYNFHLPKESKKLQIGEAYAATQTGEYQDGFMRGGAVGDKVVEGRETLKELYQGGIEISEKRKKFNAAIQACHKQAKKMAKTRGQGYYEGYFRGYSSKLEAAARSGESDSGNQGLEEAAERALKKSMNDVKKHLQKIGIPIENGDYNHLKDKEKGKNAYKEGGQAGYSDLYEQKKTEKGSFNKNNSKKTYEEKAKKQYNTYKSTKDKAGNTDLEQAGILTYYYSEGYNYAAIEARKNDAYGAPKGLADAGSFNKGYQLGSEKDLTDKEVKNKAREEKKNNGSKDAFRAGYYAARKEEGYQKFRSAMIRAANREEKNGKSTIAHVDGNKNSKRTPTTTGKDQTAAIHALTALKDDTAEKAIRDRAKNSLDSTEGGGEYDKTVTQAKGYKDAELLWAFILGRKYGLPLGDGKEKTIEITQADAGGQTTTSTFDPTNGEQATSIYNDKENFIKGVGQYYAQKNQTGDKGSAGPGLTQSPAGISTEIQADYEHGYRLAIADLEKKFYEAVVVSWQHDMGHVDGVKEVAPNAEGVSDMEHPSRPILEMGEEQTEANKDAYKQTDDYKKGYREGSLFGEKLKAGLVNIEEQKGNTTSGKEYLKGQEKGAKEGASAGEKAWEDPCHPGPLEEEIKVEGSASYKEGYIKGYLKHYWKKRDFEYGKDLAVQRIKLGIDEKSDPDPDAIVRDKDAYFKGYNLGRENAAAGNLKNTNSNTEAKKTDFEKFQDTIKHMAWRNATLVAGRELKILGVLPLIADSNNNLLHNFKNLTGVQAVLDFDSKKLRPFIDMNSKDQVGAEEGIQSFIRKRRSDEGQQQNITITGKEHILILSAYEKEYTLAHTQALIDFQNLSYTVAMGKDQGYYMSQTSQGEGDFSVPEDGGNQVFKINDLELIDRFYDLYDIIDNRRYAIEQGIKNIAFYSRLSNMSTAASVTEMQAEIKKLEADMENDAEKGQQEQMEEYQGKLTSISEKNSPFQWKWEEAEERVFVEFKRLHQFLKENISFESPFNTKKGIKDVLDVDLATSDNNGESKDVYKKLGLFDDLNIKGKIEYKNEANFMMSILGEVDLTLNEQNEQATLISTNIRLERSNFQFTATGLEHEDGDFTLFSGRTITPKLEGGPHEGRALDFEFEDLTLSSGASIKSQIEDQVPALQGG